MTQEEKELLLKDLSARLLYGVVVQEPDFYEAPLNIPTLSEFFYDGLEIKPYLRPMSSMTEGEKREVGKLGVCDDGAFHNDIYDVGICMEEAFTAISWLLKRHFDINYLIQKGLALEAPEGMYKIE